LEAVVADSRFIAESHLLAIVSLSNPPSSSCPIPTPKPHHTIQTGGHTAHPPPLPLTCRRHLRPHPLPPAPGHAVNAVQHHLHRRAVLCGGQHLPRTGARLERGLVVPSLAFGGVDCVLPEQHKIRSSQRPCTDLASPLQPPPECCNRPSTPLNRVSTPSFSAALAALTALRSTSASSLGGPWWTALTRGCLATCVIGRDAAGVWVRGTQWMQALVCMCVCVLPPFACSILTTVQF